MSNLEQLNAMHIDVLKEIGNIGAGNAATSLAQMMNSKVDMVTPVVRILDISEADNALGGPETLAVAILAELYGDIHGIMMFVISQGFTKALLKSLLNEEHSDCRRLSDMEKSALSEIGNIMISSYANSIATLSKLNIQISVPAVTSDMVGALLTVPAAEMGSVSDKIIFIQDDFITLNKTISADMLLIPDIDSLNTLMGSLGIEL
ncbi:MAG TPA: chemotaxis protein CheC [Ruminococcaceae bacterium]|nr:chemotaxis protein CheC [Oscillospiraceae bacterium]